MSRNSATKRVAKTKKSRTLWVAAGDVTAPWRVPMRRSGQPKSTEDGGSQDEVIDLFQVTGGDHGNESDQDSIGRTKKGEHRGSDPTSSRKRRPRKRPKIDDHLKFIDTQPVDEGSPDSLIPTPNSVFIPARLLLPSLTYIRISSSAFIVSQACIGAKEGNSGTLVESIDLTGSESDFGNSTSFLLRCLPSPRTSTMKMKVNRVAEHPKRKIKGIHRKICTWL